MNTLAQPSSLSHPSPVPAAPVISTWKLDGSHTAVGFRVRHMMITNVRGEFRAFAGEVHFDRAHPEAAEVSVDIEVASIDTRDDKRDAHLRSADFFAADEHPKMSFRSRRAVATRAGVDVIGDLTIRGTTREVTLAVSDVTQEHTDPWGGRRVGATASAKIKRSEFGMVWNAALEAGGVLVGDEVTIHVDASLVFVS